MKMTDLMPKEQWQELEQEIHDRFGFNACAYDKDGFTFTGYKNFTNELCPAVKASKESLQAICSTAHMNLAAQVKNTGKPVQGECDAGLVKICVPVIVNDEFVGIVGGCGRLPEGGEVETYLLAKTNGNNEAKLKELAKTVRSLTSDQAAELVSFLEEKVAAAVGTAVRQ